MTDGSSQLAAHASGPAVGDAAPDFALSDDRRQTIRLADFRGKKNVLLVFYPLTFTRVCGSELTTLRDEIHDFMTDDCVVLAISTDSSAVHRAYQDVEYLGYPLLSDFWPHGDVARAYGVFDEESGLAQRGTFLIDKSGVVRWRTVSEMPLPRSTDDYRAALAALAG